MRLLSIAVFTFLVIALTGHADDLYTENFGSFEGTFETLPSGFSVSKDGISDMPADDDDFRGIKSNPLTAGGCYAWNINGTNYALGCQPTETDFTPGWFRLSLTNATPAIIKEISISYEVICRNNEDRSSTIKFEYECFESGFSIAPAAEIERFTFTSPETGENAATWKTNYFSGKIKLPEPLRRGYTLRCTWKLDDCAGSGSRDEYGIDNINIIFHHPDGTCISVR